MNNTNQTRWTDPFIEGGRPQIALPDYARFKLIINFKNGKDSKGYKTFPSIDRNGFTGLTNEREGLAYLYNLLFKPAEKKGYLGQWRMATLYMAIRDTAVKGKNHNCELWHLRDGEWVRKRPVFFVRIPLDSCSLDTREENYTTKIDLQKTLQNWA